MSAVVFEPHRAVAWPAAGSLLLDDLPCSLRDPATGRFRIAFRVFGAAGFEAGRPKLWRLEAHTSKSQADWERFLGSMEGAPPRVVCDNDAGLTGAVRARLPQAELYLCEWHLRHALERLMAKIRKSDEHREAIDALLPRVEAAFTGPAFWEPFLRDAHAAEIPRLSEWFDGVGRTVAEQSRRRGLRSQRPADMPLSTSPMDGLIEPVRAAIHPRRYGLKNRERTNRLVTLMQLHANHQDDPLAYAKSIRAWLEANGGRPPHSPAAPSPTAAACRRYAEPSSNAHADATGGPPLRRRPAYGRDRNGHRGPRARVGWHRRLPVPRDQEKTSLRAIRPPWSDSLPWSP